MNFLAIGSVVIAVTCALSYLFDGNGSAAVWAFAAAIWALNASTGEQS